MEFITNLAVFGAMLSQLVSPLMAEADTSTEMANLSQNLIFGQSEWNENNFSFPSVSKKYLSISQGQTMTQGPTEAKPSKESLRPADRETPDKVIKTAVITAYTSTPGQTDDSPFIAASGKRVHDGMIAANGLPFGTRVKIPAVYGEKIFIVEDRMNSRYGYGRFDVWLDMSRAEARKFGVKRVEVEIFYPEKAIAKK